MNSPRLVYPGELDGLVRIVSAHLDERALVLGEHRIIPIAVDLKQPLAQAHSPLETTGDELISVKAYLDVSESAAI